MSLYINNLSIFIKPLAEYINTLCFLCLIVAFTIAGCSDSPSTNTDSMLKNKPDFSALTQSELLKAIENSIIGLHYSAQTLQGRQQECIIKELDKSKMQISMEINRRCASPTFLSRVPGIDGKLDEMSEMANQQAKHANPIRKLCPAKVVVSTKQHTVSGIKVGTDMQKSLKIYSLIDQACNNMNLLGFNN